MVYKRLERILIQLDAVDSTNIYAAELIKSSFVSNGTTILTNHQHNGKGQRSAVWTTEPEKNLTFSVIIFPSIKTKDLFYINIIASLAVQKTLSDLGLEAKIKWPNDILIGKKKICGILVENVLAGEKINSSVIGIGLNVNQSAFGDLVNATSIYLEKGQEFELMAVFTQFYSYLDFYYDLLEQSNLKILKDRYYDSFYLLNERAKFLVGDKEIEALVKGIDENGRFLLEENGQLRSFDVKEVAFRL